MSRRPFSRRPMHMYFVIISLTSLIFLLDFRVIIECRNVYLMLLSFLILLYCILEQYYSFSINNLTRNAPISEKIIIACTTVLPAFCVALCTCPVSASMKNNKTLCIVYARASDLVTCVTSQTNYAARPLYNTPNVYLVYFLCIYKLGICAA